MQMKNNQPQNGSFQDNEQISSQISKVERSTNDNAIFLDNREQDTSQKEFINKLSKNFDISSEPYNDNDEKNGFLAKLKRVFGP